MKRVLLVPGREAEPSLEQGVWKLLEAVDDEFVPPLSVRSDTASIVPLAEMTPGPLGNYLDSMRGESWLLSLDGDDVIGLLSFRIRRGGRHLRSWSPSLHATTVGVAPGARRTGVGTGLYDDFEHLARKIGVPYLTTRTWTTNDSHLRLLRSRGYKVVAQLPDHRRNGIGTVYLAYDASSLIRPARESSLLGEHTLREE